MISLNLKAELMNNLNDKLETTMMIINHHLSEFSASDQVVAWSGGKDSTVLLYLLKEYNMDVVFENTGVEYPETLEFIRKIKSEWNINLIELHPYKYNYWQCADKYGYPILKSKRHGSRIGGSPRCCYYLKERPMEIELKNHNWKAIYLGITASESHQRMIRAKTHGVCHHDKRWDI